MKTNTSFRNWYDNWRAKGNFQKGGFPVRAKDARGLIEDLTEKLPAFVPGSSGLIAEGWRVRARDFQLGRENQTVAKPAEAKAERAIFQHYQNRELCGKESSAFLAAIHSFQVPLYPHLGDVTAIERPNLSQGLGVIDLLGATNEWLPAVIEAKVKHEDVNVGVLLGAIIQGLAYTLTIRHYWGVATGLRNEWSELTRKNDLPLTLEDRKTPIIVAANREFWEVRKRWSECPWPRFVELSRALEKQKLPLFAARFESADKPELEFVPFHSLIGHEKGTDRIKWPENPS